MRKQNSTAEFEAERRKFLIDTFRRVIAGQSQVAIENAFRTTAGLPAPRFWVSEARAAAVIGKMISGEVRPGCSPEEDMFEQKSEMYREIYRRFMKIRLQQPARTICDIIFEVVNSPAPKSYISWHRVRTIIYKERRRLRNERKEPLCR